MDSPLHARLLQVLLLVSAIATAAVPLTRDGQPVGVIVHNGHDSVAPGLSARHVRQHEVVSPVEMLQNYLKQITGAELPVVATLAEAKDRPAIVLELVDRVPGASDRATAAQAYRLKTDGNHLVLTAATPLGLHYAALGLLEDHLGCRFYTFNRRGLAYAGPGFEVVPKQASLTIGDLNDLQEPAFANRGIIYWVGSYPWILQNRGIGLPGDEVSGALAAHHNMYEMLPPKGKKDVPGLFDEHPDFYPLNKDGKREPTWTFGICGTNSELPRFLAAGIERYIQKRLQQTKGELDWSRPIAVAQGDGFSGCMCDACRKLVHDEQSEAAPLILAINRALAIVKKDYPKVQLITFAYFDTLDVPKTIRPDEALWINVVSSSRSQNMAGDQMGPIDGNPANRDYARAIREWPKVAPGHVTVWNWDSYRAEWPSIFYLAENIRFMRDSGIYAVNPQYCGGPWVDLLAWVYLKLAWNPDRDADALIRQYLDDNYGKEAGAHVWAYLKLAQQGYAENLHVPSAVRWSGWTPVTRAKLFPPELLAKMTAEMDAAVAAAGKAGDPVRLGNLIGARGQSLDVVNINAASSNGKPWGPVRCAADGRDWFVTGADPLVPPSLLRAKQGIVMDGGGEHGVLRSISVYVARNGGPLVNLSGGGMAAAVCPDLKGQIVSAKAGPTELLANQGETSGYMDVFGRIAAQIWLPAEENHDVGRRSNDDWSRLWSDYQPTAADSLKTDLILSPSFYGFYPSQYLRRTATVGGDGLRVERQFIQEKGRNTLRNPSGFSTRWLLALPAPQQAKVAIKGGGIDQLLDLRYAVPGGIAGVKAGEHLPGQDNMDERFDTVIAVPDAEVTRLPVKADAGGNVVVRLDRGDGVAAVLTTPAAGWDAVEIKPVVNNNYLEVKLIGTPQPMKPEPATLDLPVQTLTSVKVPKAPATAKAPTQETPPVAPRIRVTGKTSAINEIDGAELVWIPAGGFLRGSAKDQGGADERPQRTIELDGYWIYKHPVTLAEYTKFCEAAGKEFKPTWGQGMHSGAAADDGAYAAQMNWYEADEYARWAGGALPTEAQWEKAARGTDGRFYPWGNAWEPSRCAGMEETVYQFSSGFKPLGAYPSGASPYGVEDLAGNVWEWVADWYGHDYYATAPARNPTGPETGTHKVLRGGCSLYDERFSTTTARMIMAPHIRDWTATGFRCVINAPGPAK